MTKPRPRPPTPAEIRQTRLEAGLTQKEAAELVHLGAAQRWAEHEKGVRVMDRGRWELFAIKIDRHPDFARVRKTIE
jgi:hypothetical protein